MKYVMTYDLHTHTNYSDGKGSIEDNVKAAIGKGLLGIAISDHGRGHNFYGIKGDDLATQRAEIERLKRVYPEIEIYLSVEANIFDAGKGMDITRLELASCDFIIAGYHFGVSYGYCISNWLFNKGLFRTKKIEKKLRKRNTEMMIKAINENKIKILTHPGDKAIIDVLQIAKICEEKNILMEVNLRHHHLTVEELKIVAQTNVMFIVSSDAHTPDAVGEFGPTLQRLLDAGIDLERVLNIEEVDEERIGVDETDSVVSNEVVEVEAEQESQETNDIETKTENSIASGNEDEKLVVEATEVEEEYTGMEMKLDSQRKEMPSNLDWGTEEQRKEQTVYSKENMEWEIQDNEVKMYMSQIKERMEWDTHNDNNEKKVIIKKTEKLDWEPEKKSKRQRIKPLLGVQTTMDLGIKLKENITEPVEDFVDTESKE